MRSNLLSSLQLTPKQYAIMRLFGQNKLGIISFLLLIIYFGVMLFSPFIAPYAADMQFTDSKLLPPFWTKSGTIHFFLGTDSLGRDLFSRLIHGLRYTLGSALLISTLVVIIGGFLSIIVGTRKGIQSNIVHRFLDIFLSIPILLLAIIIATLMQPSLINAILAVLLASLPYFINQLYQLIQQEINKPYVQMIRLDGASRKYMVRHIILPNIIPQLIRLISRLFILCILDISALSFISLGAQPPMPEWGIMIKEYSDLIYLSPWLVIIPGVMLMSITLSSHLFSHALARAYEQYYQRK